MTERILNYLEVSFPDETTQRGYAAYVISQMLADFPYKEPREVIGQIYKDIMEKNYQYLCITSDQVGDWLYVCTAVLKFIRSEDLKNEFKKA